MSHPPSLPIERDPAYAEDNLVWIDMEMTGLVPEVNRVIEIAAVVTTSRLEVIAESTSYAIHQSDEVLAGMDAWNTSTHGRSGLTERVRASTLNEEAASDAMLAFLARYAPRGKSPMCGNSICQDRRFMARWMPRLEDWFHYRNLDVSTLKELARRWKPEAYRSFEKKSRHEALADIYESIAELRHYRDTMMAL